jgi:hypothetical protein
MCIRYIYISRRMGARRNYMDVNEWAVVSSPQAMSRKEKLKKAYDCNLLYGFSASEVNVMPLQSLY